jgi:hypothetical protein
MKRGLSNKAKYYYIKRVLGVKALSKGVIPVVVNVF